jgi:selenocysteine-specific elongation factor
VERGVILGTAGHIDHGKTALVRALTGVDTDRLPEEKRRGITIDLGFAPLVLEGIGTIGIVDVPGHEAFVRTMLAGASGINVALLVVAADEGVMPQTREHLQILSLLAIPKLVVALTKSDLVTEEWLRLAVEDVRSVLANTAFAESRIVPVSSATGEGLSELRHAIHESFSSNVADENESRDLFRMPVDRAFTIKGTGTVVTGTVWSGSISRDSTISVFPPRRRSRVRGIQHHNAPVAMATAGQRIALALSNVEVGEVARGSIIVADDSWIPASRIDADITLLDPSVEIGPRTRLRFHLGTSDVGARITRPVKYDGGDHLRFLATVVLDEELLLRAGDRFVLRLPSPEATIGGGRVVDPLPPRRRKHTTRVDESLADSLRRMAAESGVDGLQSDVLPVRLGLSPIDAEHLRRESPLIEIRSRLYDPRVLDEIEEACADAIFHHVENYPLEPGVKVEWLRSHSRAPADVIDYVVNRLERTGRIEVDRAFARPSGWTAKLSDHQQSIADGIMHEICLNETEPPAVSELESAYGKEVPGLLRYLARKGELIKVSDDRYYSPKAVESMFAKLRAILEPGRIYTPAELKEVLGVSRKYLIPFLEFCDISGVTDRKAEGRSLGASVVSGRL